MRWLLAWCWCCVAVLVVACGHGGVGCGGGCRRTGCVRRVGGCGQDVGGRDGMVVVGLLVICIVFLAVGMVMIMDLLFCWPGGGACGGHS